MQQFRVAPAIPAPIEEAFSDLHPLTRQLLFNRGITDVETAKSFIAPSYTEGLHDPFLLNDMQEAVSRVLGAIERDERIVIFSDYDCDGIPGAVVLHDLFAAIGYANTRHVIPHRHYDGFGLSLKQVDTMVAEHQPKLIITIDCGTGDHEAIAHAKEHGVDVIVTDHHEPKDTLPDALVINPKLNGYPFPDLAGAAVAFKLAKAIIAKHEPKLEPGKEKWWLDMVGLATIADMVPLRGENRVLAYYGLTVLRKSRRPGIQQLLRAQRASQQHLTEDDIGFTIGPRINAASRMDTPEDAFHLLATRDEGEAGAYVAHLERLNTDRKTASTLITKDIHKRLKQQGSLSPVIVMGDPVWRPSLVGLAATKLAEEYNRPAFLWGRDGNGNYKGSCRSGGGISVVTLMEAVPKTFVEFGGHHHSGGFTVISERIHELADELVSAFLRLGEATAFKNELVADAELTLDAIDGNFLKAQSVCAPFGTGNSKPVYLFHNVTPRTVNIFGKSKEHTKLTFDTKGQARDAIAFFKTPDRFGRVPEAGRELSLLAHVEQSYFMGRLETRLRIIDII